MPYSSSDDRPILLLSEIDEFDPHGPPSRKWCPLCGRDKPQDGAHRCLSVDRASGRWLCFRCGHGGLAREFWTVSTPALPASGSRGAARRQLENAFSLIDEGVYSSAKSPIGNQEAAVNPPKGWLDWWQETGELLGTEGAIYLQKRAISAECARLSGVRFHPRWCQAPAIVFPIGDQKGAVVAAQGRATRGSAKITRGPKKQGAFCAVAASTFSHGFHPLRARAGGAALGFVVVVEAPLDALSLATCGVPALALCGTDEPAWLHRVCAFKDVFLGLDADEAGDVASSAIERNLHPFGAKINRLRPEGAKDWNELLLLRGQEALCDWLCCRILL